MFKCDTRELYYSKSQKVSKQVTDVITGHKRDGTNSMVETESQATMATCFGILESKGRVLIQGLYIHIFLLCKETDGCCPITWEPPPKVCISHLFFSKGFREDSLGLFTKQTALNLWVRLNTGLCLISDNVKTSSSWNTNLLIPQEIAGWESHYWSSVPWLQGSCVRRVMWSTLTSASQSESIFVSTFSQSEHAEVTAGSSPEHSNTAEKGGERTCLRPVLASFCQIPKCSRPREPTGNRLYFLLN